MKTLQFPTAPCCWWVCWCWALACCCGSGCTWRAPERPAVTFILGDDRYSVNPYYASALAYYRQNAPQAGRLVTHCRSLREVRDYLAQHVPQGQPWGTVNLVVHGNAWTGMSLPIAPGDSSRTTAEALDLAGQNGLLPPLPDCVLDRRSTLRLHGCALGRDSALLVALSRVFGGADEACPKVVSTPYFNQYEWENGAPRQSLAEFWYVTYPTYQRPPDSVLARALAAKYPDADLPWAESLQRRRPRWAGDTYWKPVVVPVHWAVTYPDSASRPVLLHPEDQQRWLAAQPELQAAIRRLGLPAERFRWTFGMETLHFDDGAAEPAVLAEGQTTVCCVLRRASEAHEFTVLRFEQKTWLNGCFGRAARVRNQNHPAR